jgi:hypothetical protein
VPFVIIQVIMVGLIIAFPNLVSGGLGKKADIDTSNVKIEAAPQSYRAESEAAAAAAAAASAPAGQASGATDNSADDAMEAVRRALQQDLQKK